MSSHHTQKDLHSQHIFPVWKLSGETLSVLLERFRNEYSIAPFEKITYAGRLDPMAEGVVLVLVGDARFEKDRLLGLEKTYEVAVVLGVSTDSADMLGMVTEHKESLLDEEAVRIAVTALQTITELPYPMYSSRPVEGKPLFVHARAGGVVEVPIKNVTIKDVSLLSLQHTMLYRCLEETLPIIASVEGDFRQEEIIRTWNEQVDMSVTIATIRVTASSGTYMRSLAEKLGESLGVPALAYRIKRTNVGGYK